MAENFGRNEKLKSKKHFELLFAEGKSVNAFPVKLVFVPIKNAENNSHKTGVSAPKRRFKKAVDRNRIKRLMREAFRKNKYLLEEVDQKHAFLLLFIGKEIPCYSQVFTSVQKLLLKFVESEKSR